MANTQQQEQWSLSYHQWITCEAYLGFCTQLPAPNGNGVSQQPSVEEQLSRAVAILHRRTEDATYVAQEVYVSVDPTGLQLSLSHQGDGHEYYNPQQRITKTFMTNRIARCSSNHQSCPRIFVWVCESESTADGFERVRRRMECHGVLCQTQRDAIRLAHTLSNAFQYMYQSSVLQPNHLMQPLRRANALPPLTYHPVAEVPLADIAMLPSYAAASAPPARGGGSNAVRGNEVSRTFAGDMTVALSSPPPDYQSRPGSAMSISARRVASPLLDDGGGMPYLD